jgi:hypothetical protein
MIVIALGLEVCADPAYATRRPLWAVNGTGTGRFRSELACTLTATSSRGPRAPVNTTFVTPLRRDPRSLSFPPSRTRPRDMQLAAHFTLLIAGVGT